MGYAAVEKAQPELNTIPCSLAGRKKPGSREIFFVSLYINWKAIFGAMKK
jgi:hypothetical protein